MPRKISGITISDGAALIEIDKKIYPLEAILTATYFYIEDFYVFLSHKDKAADCVQVELCAKKKTSATRLEDAASGFFNTLLAETLRLAINERNKKFREELLEKAIASALAPEPPAAAADGTPSKVADVLELDEELRRIIEKVKDMDYRKDPLGIGKPVAANAPAEKAKTKTKKKK
jgi:His-Xaa-Ser system protein HxsD